jgi:hypothetical protein
MVKDTATRLAAGVSDLRALVVSLESMLVIAVPSYQRFHHPQLAVKERGDMNEEEELLKAEEVLEIASA